MKNKKEKEKIREQKETLKYEAKILNLVISFIFSSKKTLDMLYDLSLKDKQQLTLDVATVTKVCSRMCETRQSAILTFHLQIINLNDEINELQNELTNLEANKKANKWQDYSSKKYQICKEISTAKKEVISIQEKISAYESEVKTYYTALQICAEFGRRLNFYLSMQE